MACLGHDASKCGTVAFDLWDDTLRLIDTLTARCPGPNEEIWKLIKGDQDVVLEPTVAGETGVEARGELP